MDLGPGELVVTGPNIPLSENPCDTTVEVNGFPFKTTELWMPCLEDRLTGAHPSIKIQSTPRMLVTIVGRTVPETLISIETGEPEIDGTYRIKSWFNGTLTLEQTND